MSDIHTTYQPRCMQWVRATFSQKPEAHGIEQRSYRFLEEALELAQSVGVNKQDALALVDYVYDRPTGKPAQEVGGTLMCLAALCEVLNIDMFEAGEVELKRAWQNSAAIRAKDENKPNQTGPLPGVYEGGAL